MSFSTFAADIANFVKENQGWAPYIVALLCFLESLAVVSFFVPAWLAITLIGGLIGATGISFWPVWFGAVIGATLGDWLSYVVGYYFKDTAHHRWPLSRYPEFTKRADEFTRKWGWMGVFIGRFSGPLRAFVPLAAGIFAVPRWQFQFANVTSAIVWAFVLLLPGWVIKYLQEWQVFKYILSWFGY